VRPEFRVEIYVPDRDDHVLGTGECAVAACDGGRWARALCETHWFRWAAAGRPDVDDFAVTASPRPERAEVRRAESFDFRGLPPRFRIELQFALQRRHDAQGHGLSPRAVNRIVALALDAGDNSLLDRPLLDWLALIESRGWKWTESAKAFLRYVWAELEELGDEGEGEAEYARDVWHARRLGLDVRGSHHRVSFDRIEQPWLRASVKRWVRFRLGSGRSLPTVQADAKALTRFARFLIDCYPDLNGGAELNRAALEHFLSWLSSSGLAAKTRADVLVKLRTWLDDCRRHSWLVGLSSEATIYSDDLPRPANSLPRFIPEFVMGQLESVSALERLPDATTRNLVILIMETGLRSGDARALPFNPLVDDSVGWPFLRFLNSKVASEQLIPLSPAAAGAIRAQQEHVRECWPAGSPWLFPRVSGNSDGTRPFSYDTLRLRLARWQDAIDVRDEASLPVRVTAHQFRHTVGTRLANAGVPQHLIQKLLGHRSPHMTAVYAHLHDTTLRRAFDEYCQQRVNIAGEVLDYDPDLPTAEAEWVKHNVARIHDSLPNGYCGRPPQQDCPHPNACLTCPDFQTTPEFLDVHRRQRETNRKLIATAEANGQFRLAANHHRVQDSLDRIIPALEAVQEGGCAS
jgi:integrase